MHYAHDPAFPPSPVAPELLAILPQVSTLRLGVARRFGNNNPVITRWPDQARKPGLCRTRHPCDGRGDRLGDPPATSYYLPVAINAPREHPWHDPAPSGAGSEVMDDLTN